MDVENLFISFLSWESLLSILPTTVLKYSSASPNFSKMAPNFSLIAIEALPISIFVSERAPSYPETILFSAKRTFDKAWFQDRFRSSATAVAVDTIASAASATRQTSLRSEEHTSELQSHLNLVCRLLLEKKKKSNTQVLNLRAYASSCGVERRT